MHTHTPTQVFRLQNFFTAGEADELIRHTLSMDHDPVHGLHRSTTGQGAGTCLRAYIILVAWHCLRCAVLSVSVLIPTPTNPSL